jgi:hypothetical protein
MQGLAINADGTCGQPVASMVAAGFFKDEKEFWSVSNAFSDKLQTMDWHNLCLECTTPVGTLLFMIREDEQSPTGITFCWARKNVAEE